MGEKIPLGWSALPVFLHTINPVCGKNPLPGGGIGRRIFLSTSGFIYKGLLLD
jgi:hypothetical protein